MALMERFKLKRLGVVMRSNPADSHEAWGVLNPACARGKDGELYLFPRLVAPNNYSRIGMARVKFDDKGDPYDVERLGVALEPTEHYEQNLQTAGCEDPRVVYIEKLESYLMTYTAYGPLGPRIALALSTDLMSWKRLGPVSFAFQAKWQMDFNLYSNKDAIIFPEPINDPSGRPAIAMLHRPTYDVYSSLNNPALPANVVLPTGVEDPRPSIWISYCPLEKFLSNQSNNLIIFEEHHLLMTPSGVWQRLKVGGGTPPIKTSFGWLTLFHGVSGGGTTASQTDNVHYAAGALVLDLEDPRQILFRSVDPILEPELPEECEGVVSNVVFPTGVDLRENGRLDVYYGMADERIGAATLQLPTKL
jgi:beta-1,2-mannobiose phosphorylase / 1,2-beta-oligomannan phosphorylase